MAGLECSGFTFYNDFDSANLAKVELVPPTEPAVTTTHTGKLVIPEIPDAEFNIWTKRDCAGTEYENGNRTWFYFGFKANAPTQVVKFNIVDLNRVGKMYSQGMAPVYKIVPGRSQWERIRDKVTHSLVNGVFIVSFKYRMPENLQSTSFLAFTYPFPYSDLQKMLINIDNKYLTVSPNSVDDIYYVRECVSTSLEGRRIDLITISSYHGISSEREIRLKNLFPDQNVPRPYRFIGKKVIFMSARVHPGETPSSFVMNGFISLLLNREDPVAIVLRRLYVFKIIPVLNPDGVAKGHYRTDTRGVNLNRVYLNPLLSLHPSVYAARALIRYYHYGFEKEDIIVPSKCDGQENTDGSVSDDENVENDNINEKVSHMSLEENQTGKSIWCFKCKSDIVKLENNMPGISNMIPKFNNINNAFKIGGNMCRNCGLQIEKQPSECNVGTEVSNKEVKTDQCHGDVNSNESGLFVYIDMHGHASKKGIFMYGNHFEDIERNVECMLLPKLMSINNYNFHFTACNFTERIMYLRDKRDGLSREGSGRVAVLKLTGLIRSYTLECNYNTGRIVNVLPPSIRDGHSKMHTINVPPKYTPQVYEEVGRALGASILDLTSQNPCTRLPNSEFHTLNGLREWLRTNYQNEMGETKSVMTQTRLKHTVSNHSQGKSTKGSTVQPKLQKKRINKARPMTVPVERKENIICSNNQPSCSHSPSVIPQRHKAGSHISKSSKSKSKKDVLLKNKNPNNEKQKTKVKQKVLLSSQKVRPESTRIHIRKGGADKDDNDRVQLREICFLKSNIGKALIAKYKTGDDDMCDDNLVVSWEGSANNPQVFSQKTRIPTLPFLPMRATSEPGTSKQGAFRVHNFSKSSSYPKTKNKKHTLRRLASASETFCKVEKVKRKKKMKAK